MSGICNRVVAWLLLASLIVPLFGVASPGAASAQEATPATDCATTTPEENQVLAQAYHEEVVWADQGQILAMLSPDLAYHWGIGGETTGINAFSERLDVLLDAFPDLEFSIHQVMAQNDLVATRWTATGTHSGEWMDIAPTGNEVLWNGIDLFRIECGLVAEAWDEADYVGLLAKLGATDVPAWLATPGAVDTMAAPVATPCADDSAEANIKLAQRWVEEVWTDQNLDVISEIFHPSAIHHGANYRDLQGPEAIAEVVVSQQLAAFPDLNYSIDAALADDGLVVVRWSGPGTHEGELFGLEPTGKVVNMTGFNVFRISCGKIVEFWGEMNMLQVLQELRGDASEATPAA